MGGKKGRVPHGTLTSDLVRTTRGGGKRKKKKPGGEGKKKKGKGGR